MPKQTRLKLALSSIAVSALFALSACAPPTPATGEPSAEAPGFSPEQGPTTDNQDRGGTDNTPLNPDHNVHIPSTSKPAQEDSSHRLIKNVGELAGVILRNDPSVRLVNFTVSEIHDRYVCPVNPDLKASNGKFIALRFEVETLSRLAQSSTPYFGISPKDFTTENSAGTSNVESLDTWAAHACLDDGSGLPAKILPNQKIQGLVILDAPSDARSVILSQNDNDGPGWVWRLPTVSQS